ncbi:toll/interleukin-1 receptor domain-containing protein [Sphingomonas sp. HDW15A]|uniref:toll/interleukin-1 receptor domain-containing protein n=1 Tax=Sphingomonas sp. HDW15A TaxID=2714942 RepID=UPI0014086704|nr:toll/interleukin-1 receptor domain-containing protein [Sphingomonas sp. HDW15A]QIK95907.1 toll/interleukin-1 receptor domain-containing protein [Sphingomonas sp. HDW15A]
MNLPDAASDQDRQVVLPVFISYATADRKKALSVCKAIERHGAKCWIASRDVAPGQNYQEAIVDALRNARAMVLVFSGAANKSDEIKKELSLASRLQVPVMTLRIEDVEPSDAFAYELATRQWIDAFKGWDRSIDLLIGSIGEISPAGARTPAIERTSRPVVPSPSRRRLLAGAVVFAILIAGGAWFELRPSPSPDHPMEIRLAEFQLLSKDLPGTTSEAIANEIIAAFNDDGVVGVSTASAPAQGKAPAYALGGTLQRNGDVIRVITRLTNERSGATIWSDSRDYPADQGSKVPRRIAVDAGNVIRCGLFGASTYPKTLPDAALQDYLQFCQGHWDPSIQDGRKALVPAQRVVAAIPDFSWGWAAVAGGYWKVAIAAENNRLAEEARKAGRQAADRAIEIDGKNSEAMWIKSLLIDRLDWIEREKLLKRAIAVRSLDCGCEHHQYGEMLLSVGRTAEAVEQLRQANDMLALYVYTALSLARALVLAEMPEDAKAHFDAAIDLAPDPGMAEWIAFTEATDTADIEALDDPGLPMTAELRAALLEGYRALASRKDTVAKGQAIKALLALPKEQQGNAVARLLAGLGASRDAFQLASRIVIEREGSPSIFWYRSMRETLRDPRFPPLAQRLGLLKYWETTRTKPDVCQEPNAPRFCEML